MVYDIHLNRTGSKFISAISDDNVYNMTFTIISQHTKLAFREHEVLTVQGVIVQNALILLHQVRNMSSLLPKSISQLFPPITPKLGTTHEQNLDWASIYSQTNLMSGIFYKGPMLAVSEHNARITCPSSIFSINIQRCQKQFC